MRSSESSPRAAATRRKRLASKKALHDWLVKEVASYGVHHGHALSWMRKSQDDVLRRGDANCLTVWIDNEIGASDANAPDHEFPVWVMGRAAELARLGDPRGRQIVAIAHPHLLLAMARVREQAIIGDSDFGRRRCRTIDKYVESVVRTGLVGTPGFAAGTLFESCILLCLPATSAAIMESPLLRKPYLETAAAFDASRCTDAARALLAELQMHGARPASGCPRALASPGL